MSRYRVTGSTAYLGHQPGEEFDAELTDDQERRAVARGSIKPIKTPKTEPESEGE